MKRRRVLVTGADGHHGLGVIRGLRHAGAHVIAGGAQPRGARFRSRYASATFCYAPPASNLPAFVGDLLEVIERTKPDLVVPADDASLAGMLAARFVIEARAPLAAASPPALARLCDLRSALQLAQRLRVPTPQWTTAPSAAELIQAVRALRPPYVIKPRAHGGASDLPVRFDFRAAYAADFGELARMVERFGEYADRLVVLEQWRGVTRVVSGVWRNGRAVARLAFERERELPGVDGASVVRTTIPLDATLDVLTTRLFADAEWNGAGLAEFNYDRRTGVYTFLGVRSQLHDAASLCIPAGMNLPWLAAAVHLDEAIPEQPPYRQGVVQRWLGGDVRALWSALTHRDRRGAVSVTDRRETLWRFVRDFGRASHYDELRAEDWVPTFIEASPVIQLGGRSGSGVSLTTR